MSCCLSICNSKKIHNFYRQLFLNKHPLFVAKQGLYSFFKKIFKNFTVCCIKPATNQTFSPISERLFKPITERRICIKELTSKEKLFCIYYASGRSAPEAAAKAGFRFAEKTGFKLLKKESIKEEIKRCFQQRRDEKQNVSEGYYRLAFGCVSDAVKLLFADEVPCEEIARMDLFNISEIKRKKGGDIEIKFFDRLKALDRLGDINLREETDDACSLYSAIEKGAKALGADFIEQR